METNKNERNELIAQPEGQQNRQVEEALICSILLSKTAMLKVAPTVKAGMFSDPYLGLIYRAMDELHGEGNTPDLMTVDVKARRELLALREVCSTGVPACTLEEMAGEVLEMYARREEDKDNVNYIRTGIESLDHVIGGFYNGELTVLAGRPGDGKTATAMFMAIEAAMAGKSVCYYSMEMTKLQTMNRIFTGYAGVNSHHLRMGGISREEWY